MKQKGVGIFFFIYIFLKKEHSLPPKYTMVWGWVGERFIGMGNTFFFSSFSADVLQFQQFFFFFAFFKTLFRAMERGGLERGGGFFFASDVNHVIGCRTVWLGVHPGVPVIYQVHGSREGFVFSSLKIFWCCVYFVILSE